MGTSLLTIGWTARSSDYDEKAVLAVLATLTDEWFAENAEPLDPAGMYEVEELRDRVMLGAEDYDGHLSGTHRYGTVYDVPSGDDLLFYLAGGGSYGDEPYENWSDLAVFINACDILPALAAAAGFFGGGIAL